MWEADRNSRCWHFRGLNGRFCKDFIWFVILILHYGLCTHFSAQPELVKKGPWGTRQCLNPNIRSEGFLLLSRINQMIYDFHNSTQKDKYFTSIRPTNLLRGSTCQTKILCSKWYVLGESPHKTQKAYFNRKFIKNNILYAIFEGGGNVKVIKYKWSKCWSCILCELDSGLT